MRGRYNNHEENDLVSMLRDLVRRVEDLERGSGIGNTSIDSGDLSIGSGSLSVGSVPTVYFGPMVFGGDNASGWIYRRGDGSVAFTITGTAYDNQQWELQDSAGNVLVGDDIQDLGLARPYIHFNFVEHANTVPTLTTTSATFVPLSTGRFVKQHPYVQVEVLCYASTGATSGEVQLYNPTTGLALGTPTAIALGEYVVKTLGPYAMDGTLFGYQELEVQARRTAGAGNIGIRVMDAYGVESP